MEENFRDKMVFNKMELWVNNKSSQNNIYSEKWKAENLINRRV